MEVADFQPHKICPWPSRTINVIGIPRCTRIKVLLIAVEGILNAGADFKGKDGADMDGTGKLQIELYKLWSVYQIRIS